MSTTSEYAFPLRFDPAQHQLNGNPGVPNIVLTPVVLAISASGAPLEDDARHAAQKDLLPKPLPPLPNQPPAGFSIELDRRFLKMVPSAKGPRGGTAGYSINKLTSYDEEKLFPAGQRTADERAQLHAAAKLTAHERAQLRAVGKLTADDLETLHLADTRLAKKRTELGSASMPTADELKQLAEDVLNGLLASNQRSLYLFNVIVALEWRPSSRTLRRLIAAFQHASNLLYDATDGQMAFGQVVFGGQSMFHCADVQICASNRYYPRSWVDGLLDAQKYTPIRLGRGWWRKDLEHLFFWSDSQAVPVIVHEWCHYALGLKDEYLAKNSTPTIQGTPGRLKIASPPGQIASNVLLLRPAVGSGSIMENIEGPSEIAPHSTFTPGPAATNPQRLKERYPGTIGATPPLEGPQGLAIDLPVFQYLLPDSSPEEILWDVQADPLFKAKPTPDHCWVYLLRGSVQQGWEKLIPQGVLDGYAGSEGFELLGFRQGDKLLVLGTSAGRLVTYMSDLTVEAAVPSDLATNQPGKPKVVISKLILQIPADKPADTPVVTVIPALPQPSSHLSRNNEAKANTERITQIKLRVAGVDPELLRQEPRLQAWVFPLGEPQANNRWPREVRLTSINASSVAQSGWLDGLPSLDGQVLLTLDGEPLLVADYSEGGGPDTSVRAPEPPISAGSSEGNLMFYFNGLSDEQDARDQAFSTIRIVTTRNYGGFEAVAGALQPRSYLFSFAASRNIPINPLTPTMVLTYDTEALTPADGTSLAASAAELQLHRYDEGSKTWALRPVYAPAAGRIYYPLGREANDDLSGDPQEREANDDLPGGPAEIYHYRLFLANSSGGPQAMAAT